MQITNEQSFQAMRLAFEMAKQTGVNANIAILDTYGYLKAFQRMDDAFLGSIDIALGKAKTAMLFRMNSEQVGTFLQPSKEAYGMVNTNGGLVAFPGGMPVKAGGEIVGYIGVSGGSPDQDFVVATAGSNI